eukprot:13635-Heterococcus_DN1.PRE.6
MLATLVHCACQKQRFQVVHHTIVYNSDVHTYLAAEAVCSAAVASSSFCSSLLNSCDRKGVGATRAKAAAAPHTANTCAAAYQYIAAGVTIVRALYTSAKCSNVVYKGCTAKEFSMTLRELLWYCMHANVRPVCCCDHALGSSSCQ